MPKPIDVDRLLSRGMARRGRAGATATWRWVLLFVFSERFVGCHERGRHGCGAQKSTPTTDSSSKLENGILHGSSGAEVDIETSQRGFSDRNLDDTPSTEENENALANHD